MTRSRVRAGWFSGKAVKLTRYVSPREAYLSAYGLKPTLRVSIGTLGANFSGRRGRA
jgi:hypothetical protein